MCLINIILIIMKVIEDVVKEGLNNLGNESLYTLMELMRELNWDVTTSTNNKKIQEDYIKALEQSFTFLYNCKILPDQHLHSEIHSNLYDSLRLLNILSIPQDQIFETLTVRDPATGKMQGFSDRFKNILQNSLEGLKKL